MKHIFLLLFCCNAILIAVGQSSGGNWDAYLMEIEHKPISVIVDLAFGTSPQAKERPNVIILNLNLYAPKQDGMPPDNQVRILDIMENSLVKELGDKLKSVYTGRYTKEGKRDFYFYTNDTSSYQQYINEVLRNYPLYSWKATAKRDADQGNYYNVLYPTQKELQRIQNRRMVDELHSEGDQLTAPRKVNHFIFFKTEIDRKKYAHTAQDSGFVVENAGKELGVKDRPFSLQVSRVDKIDYKSIDKVSLWLWELALQCSARYDGWETFVVKSEQ